MNERRMRPACEGGFCKGDGPSVTAALAGQSITNGLAQFLEDKHKYNFEMDNVAYLKRICKEFIGIGEKDVSDSEKTRAIEMLKSNGIPVDVLMATSFHNMTFENKGYRHLEDTKRQAEEIRKRVLSDDEGIKPLQEMMQNPDIDIAQRKMVAQFLGISLPDETSKTSDVEDDDMANVSIVEYQFLMDDEATSASNQKAAAPLSIAMSSPKSKKRAGTPSETLLEIDGVLFDLSKIDGRAKAKDMLAMQERMEEFKRACPSRGGHAVQELIEEIEAEMPERRMLPA